MPCKILLSNVLDRTFEMKRPIYWKNVFASRTVNQPACITYFLVWLQIHYAILKLKATFFMVFMQTKICS